MRPVLCGSVAAETLIRFVELADQRLAQLVNAFVCVRYFLNRKLGMKTAPDWLEHELCRRRLGGGGGGGGGGGKREREREKLTDLTD